MTGLAHDERHTETVAAAEVPSRMEGRISARAKGANWPASRALSWIEWTMLAGALLVAAWLRLRNLDYNTAFNDESINVLIGRSVVEGKLSPSPIPWNFGWYLFPLMALGADQLGGLVGMRVMAGVLGVITIAAAGWTARRAFGTREAIVTVILLTGLSPFVHSTRVAFREAGTLCFLSIAIACFVDAWLTDRRRMWLASALAVVAAFLCKHPVGIYAPPMMLLAWTAGANGRRWFALTVFSLLLGYGLYYLPEMVEMWGWLQRLPTLKAPSDALWEIYGRQRLDLWVLFAMAVAGFAIEPARQRGIRLLFIAGAALFALTHVVQRADYLTYKQAAYVLMLLAPVAAYSLVQGFERLGRHMGRFRSALIEGATLTTSLGLAVPLALAGRDWKLDRMDVGVRWQNHSLAVDYLRAWSDSTRRVLVDDQSLRYALSPAYRTDQFVDAFYFRYAGVEGASAYAAAVRDGHFDFIVLDGNGFGESEVLRRALAPVLAQRYTLAVASQDSITGVPLEVYRRLRPAIGTSTVRRSRIVMHSPASGARIDAKDVMIRGRVLDPERLERVGVEV